MKVRTKVDGMIWGDRLSAEASLTRMQRLARGMKVDRVPLLLSLSSYAPKVYGLSSREFYLNPEAAFEANQKLAERFPADAGIGYTVPNAICMDFGGEVDFRSDSIEVPKIVRYPVESEQEALALQVPDPWESPAFLRELEYARIGRRHGGKGCGMPLSSPFRQAAEIAGGTKMMRWMARSPECVDHLCRTVLEFSIKKAEIYRAEFGAENLSNAFSYPMESHHLISPEMFRRFSAPYALELHQRLEEMGVHAFSEHLCGNHRHNLWFWRSELHLPKHTLITVGEEMPLEEVSMRLGPHVVLGGNLATETLVLGTPGQVYEEAVDILQRMKNREGGFVLAAACVISTAVPEENITAMIRAVEDAGYYE